MTTVYLKAYKGRGGNMFIMQTHREAWVRIANAKGSETTQVDLLQIGTAAPAISLKVTYHNSNHENSVLHAMREWWCNQWAEGGKGGAVEVKHKQSTMY